MRIFWVNDFFATGKLGMMARPRGKDWLEDEILKLKHHDIDVIVSLLEREEELELAIEQEKQFCEKYSIEFVSFPIQDRSIPLNKKEFDNFIDQLYKELQQGKNIVIHCRMGIGRTSLVCASLLLKTGIEKEKVFDILSKTRTLSVPDTQEQIDFIIK